jgi:hypothetical protein
MSSGPRPSALSPDEWSGLIQGWFTEDWKITPEVTEYTHRNSNCEKTSIRF